VLVDGVNRGTINVVARSQGQIEFDTDPDQPGELPLTFDPWGEIDVVQESTNTLVLSLSPGCTIP
jgi:hypothetical protein